MGFKSNILHVPMPDSGFNFSRNFELLPDAALIDPSTNYNLHNLGVECRGGTSIIENSTVNDRVMGGYDFRQSNGDQNMVYAKQNGVVYANTDSNPIATGMSISNFFSFSQFYDTLYIADGSTTPQAWTGGGLATPVTPASDWAVSGNPFQIVFHPRGANFRNWAITKNGVYASASNNGSDFADADVTYIPVYSKSGLIGGYTFGTEFFVCSLTETFRIDDSNSDPTQWGYENAIWSGGAAHWRLMVHADNDMYIMTDDLTIYSLQGVFQTGDYRSASVSRPAQIDRYLRENSTFVNIQNWHAAYDPKIRAIKWFIQISGTNTNTALVQFIDRAPDKMWAIHNNLNFPSGYTCSCSFTDRKTTSDWRIRTGDYSGNIWELEQISRNDNNQAIPSVMKFKPWEFTNPVMHKRFNKGVLRVRSNTNMNFVINVWVDNVRIPDIDVTVAGSGAVFDTARFDIDVFAADQISNTPFDIKTFGKLMQFQINHNTLNEDFFFAEILIAYKENGIRIYDGQLSGI
jgi:hypothetical protein